METWTLAETAHNPLISPDGKFIIAGSGKATITNVLTRVSKVLFPSGAYVGGFISNAEARLVNSTGLQSCKLIDNWAPKPLAAIYKKANTYAVANGHSGINQVGSGLNNIILDDVMLLNDQKATGLSLANDFLVFSHNEGEPRYWLWKYDINLKQYVDKFRPVIGANTFITNWGYISYGYYTQCWIRTPNKTDVNITVNPENKESPAWIIKVSDTEFWALSQVSFNGSDFLVLRPVGDKKVISLPYGAVKGNGTFVDGHFWITGADTSGKIRLSKIPLSEPRALLGEEPIPVPPVNKDRQELIKIRDEISLYLSQNP